MKKTKKENFVARIFRWIRNLVRIARLLYNKRHRKAGRIVKNETIRTFIMVQKETIRTYIQAHNKFFRMMEIIAPIPIAGIGILAVGSFICWVCNIGISRDTQGSLIVFLIFIVGIAFLYTPIREFLERIKDN